MRALNQSHLAESYTPLPSVTEIGKGIAVLNGWSLIRCKYPFHPFSRFLIVRGSSIMSPDGVLQSLVELPD